MEIACRSSDVTLMTSESGEVLRSGDVEKEREIEERMRELGLWESKKALERRVKEMLDGRITETDDLVRSLKACRRSRNKSHIDELRNVILPEVIRDSYGQPIAYKVNILMGHFTRDVTSHVNAMGAVEINGWTPAGEGGEGCREPLNKEILVQLPSGVDMRTIDIKYVAGVVKIRVSFKNWKQK